MDIILYWQHVRAVSARLLILVGTLALASLTTSCTTTAPEPGYGIQDGHLGYVPARIAIVPCRVWPAGARFESLPLSSAKDLEMAALCTAFDAQVVAAFEGQPYMKGFSPKFVATRLTEAGRAGALAEIETLWRHGTNDCMSCSSAPAFYTKSITPRTDWVAWLASFSTAVRNADAILMPFVMYAYEKTYNDRGLVVAERAAGLSLLLVDTGTAELLWAGGRQAVVPAKRLESTSPPKEPLVPPPWEVLHERVFAEDLWRDFPGRQVF